MVDRNVDPVQLATRMTNVVRVVIDMIELVNRNGQLQERNRHQGKPRQASSPFRSRQIVVHVSQVQVPDYAAETIDKN